MNQQLPISDQIAAIIPRYTQTGDSTIIITTKGNEQTIPVRVHTIIKRLARNYSMDLIALKQKTMAITNHALLQPLPLAPGLVLCPIKLRIPRIPGDTTIGYINFHAALSITGAQNKPYQSIIKLAGGIDIPSLWQPSTIKMHLQDATLVLAHTAHSAQIPIEITLIGQKITEAIYALLSMQSLHYASDHNLITVRP